MAFAPLTLIRKSGETVKLKQICKRSVKKSKRILTDFEINAIVHAVVVTNVRMERLLMKPNNQIERIY